MKLETGDKNTDFGIVPEDWRIVKFNQLADKNINWSITGGPFGSNLKASDYLIEGVRIIQLQNIGDGVFNNTYAIFTSEKKANELINCNIYAGEIILSKMGDPVARACFLPTTDKRYLMASDGIRLVVDESLFDKRFVLYFINSPYFRKKAIGASTGSTRQRIGLQDLKKLLFVSPPLPEQRAIAEALSDVDALITALDALIAKKRAIKQGVMQELLTGKRRLPGFSGEWKEKSLHDIAIIFKGKGLSKSGISNCGINKCILYGELFTTYDRVINRVLSSTDLENGVTSKKGDVLMPGSTTTIGIDLAIASAVMIDDVMLGGDINIIRPNSNNSYSPIFLAYYLTNVLKHEIANITQGITIIHLYGTNLQNIIFRLPSLEEQEIIAKIITDIDCEITSLEQKRDKTKALKQGMMQELLTGRIRLLGG